MYFFANNKGVVRTLVTSCPMSTVYRIIRINIFLDYYKRHRVRYILCGIALDRQINESYFMGFVYWKPPTNPVDCWHRQLTVAIQWDYTRRGRTFFIPYHQHYFLHLTPRRIFYWLLYPFHLHSKCSSQIIGLKNCAMWKCYKNYVCFTYNLPIYTMTQITHCVSSRL